MQISHCNKRGCLGKTLTVKAPWLRGGKAGHGATQQASMKSKILIATTCRWFSTARLAMALANTGCVVEAVHPSRHLLDHVRSLSRSYPHSGLSPFASFRAAIVSARPDFVIPCDDLATLHLHRLCERAGQAADADSTSIREVLEKSVGDPAYYPLIESRNEVTAVARDEGIATPETDRMFSGEQVKDWLKRHGVPAVLKADGTSGGEGVEIVHTPEEALKAFRTLLAPVSAHIALKRAMIDHETDLIIPSALRRRRKVSIQSFIRGRDANIAVACWHGKVLASISAEVLCASRPKGPASIVRLLPDGEMLRATEKIVARLNISGLCGLDFMIDDRTQTTYFIEINARSTQTCPLALGDGHNPAASLYSVIANVALPELPAVTENRIIAFFPSAFLTNPTCGLFRSAYHDVPWDEPELVRSGMAKPSRFTYEAWMKFRARLRNGRAEKTPEERTL
jgi:hypothetical protein